ncbi:hypothetical protein QR680_001824 [Steinernema hermaphroditum]|uniref:Uncharacterized protein n=1 Tax=Steinernema hermaphroditum TaxID=289476 RepID=A0AA39H016_9BILA|nr:hypothetical protein QR680_001824 [Steinernema hermaphroditum]
MSVFVPPDSDVFQPRKSIRKKYSSAVKFRDDIDHHSALERREVIKMTFVPTLLERNKQVMNMENEAAIALAFYRLNLPHYAAHQEAKHTEAYLAFSPQCSTAISWTAALNEGSVSYPHSSPYTPCMDSSPSRSP